MIAAITGVLVVVVYALGSVLRNSFEKDLACLSKPVNPNAPC